MQHRIVSESRSPREVDIAHASGLLASLGDPALRPFAVQVLRTARAFLPIEQCTLFAYEFGNRPRTVAAADQRDGRDEVASDAYRATCYDRPGVQDRVALLLHVHDDVSLSLNLYRSVAHGSFSANELEILETLAPLLGAAARQHYTLLSRTETLPEQMLKRLMCLCPALTKRETDVVRGVLSGASATAIGERMGIAVSSVVTYQKRAYRRLGIGSQRELFALAAGSAH
jgi:DNA-binding CsgD family transcriptional regulator